MKKFILVVSVLLFSIVAFAQENQEVNLDEYGGKISYGIALGGGGLVGVPVRIHPTSKFAMEIGAFYRPAIVVNDDEGETLSSVVIAGGPTFYLKKHYKAIKQKVKFNGLSFKAGIGFGEFTTYMLGCGWIHESFKKINKNHSFTLELGPGLVIADNLPAGYYEYEKASFALYWKLSWNWYSK